MDELQTNAVSESPVTETQGVRRRLGRGLNALLGGSGEEHSPHDVPEAKIDPNQIDVELIEPNPFQPRKDFDQESLQELVDSLKQHGILQPLLVRPIADRYQLIAGERRLLAARQAGLTSVPCRVLELDDRKVFEAAIEENLKRRDLGVLEKARAFKDYLDRFGGTIEELASQLSLNRSTVSNFLRLLDLPVSIQKALQEDRISNGHARALLSLPEDQQVELCKRIQSESLSVRATEEAVRELAAASGETVAAGEGADLLKFPEEGKGPRKAAELSNHIRSLQDQLRDLLGAKVDIRLSAKEKGKIVISFDSNDQFEHILRQIRRAA